MFSLAHFASWVVGDHSEIGEVGDEAAVAEETPGAEGDEASDEDVLDADEESKRVGRLMQQFSVLLEYERLQDLLPSGMYVMPSLDSELVWHGALFARQGLYRGGVFKFQLLLPKDYPDSAPELYFLSEVFHPMVDLGTGRVDIGVVFPEWRPGRDYASFVLPHLYRSFLRREYFTGKARTPFNAEAQKLFLEDPAAFTQRAAECAQRSLETVHKAVAGSSLQFSRAHAGEHGKILDALRSTGAADASIPSEERKALFMRWFCNHYTSEKPRAKVQVRESKVETIMVSNLSRPSFAAEVMQLESPPPAAGEDEELSDEGDSVVALDSLRVRRGRLVIEEASGGVT